MESVIKFLLAAEQNQTFVGQPIIVPRLLSYGCDKGVYSYELEQLSGFRPIKTEAEFSDFLAKLSQIKIRPWRQSLPSEKGLSWQLADPKSETVQVNADGVYLLTDFNFTYL